MSGFRTVERCQSCGSSSLLFVASAGSLPPVNGMQPQNKRRQPEMLYPAELYRCFDCDLVQLGLVVAKEVLFPSSYPYVSRTTKVLRDNFADLHGEACGMLALGPDDLVVDVGSNDGTLLSFFKDHHRVLGIEPTDAADYANENGVPTLKSYFDNDAAITSLDKHGLAKLVTAANVFAHIDDPNEVVENVVTVMGKGDGVFVSESHYLLPLLEQNQYDTIYHEHLRYYSLASLVNLLKRHGLEVFHARHIPSHGGSIRVYAGRKGRRPVQASVGQMLEGERNIPALLNSLQKRMVGSRLELLSLLSRLNDGSVVWGVGAPSRATTLVNYVGLDGILGCILEVPSSPKVGKLLPGTRIPVCSEEILERFSPDYLLLLSWHIADELMPKLRAKGFKGQFIVPLPEPRVVE